MANVSKSRRHRREQRRVSVFVIAFIALTVNLTNRSGTATSVNAMSLLSNSNNKKVPRINQWKVSPEDGSMTGIVMGHPVLEDGDEITTSPLTNPDIAMGGEGTIVTTLSGTKYKLETPKIDNNTRKQLSFMGFVRKTKEIDTQISSSSLSIPSNPLKKTGHNASQNIEEPTIDDWKIDPSNGRIVGIVSGHPVLPDGDFISASPPIENNFKEGSIITTESGSFYKLKAPKNEKDGSIFYRKPQPPTFETTQQEIDDQITKLDSVKKADHSSNDMSGGKILGVATAAGVAGVVGLNIMTDPNSIISTNFNNNKNTESYKIMVENKSNDVVSKVSSSSWPQNKKLMTNDEDESKGKMAKEEIGRLNEQREKGSANNDNISPAKKPELDRQNQQIDREIRSLEKNGLIFQRKEREVEISKRNELEGKKKIQLQKLLQERERAKLRLEAAASSKKEVERKVVANEKAKVELQQRQEELERLRKQSKQQNELLLLQKQEQREQMAKNVDKSMVSKEKIEQQEIERVYTEAREANALAKELKQRLKSEERSSILNTIRTGVAGIAAAGFTGAAGLVTSFEIRRRLSERSVEKNFEVSTRIETSIENLDESINKTQTTKPLSTRLPTKASFAENITDKLKFVDEIDDLLAEVEDVLAEVDSKTLENLNAKLATDGPSQLVFEPALGHFENVTEPSEGGFVKEEFVGGSYFRSQISSVDGSFLPEEYVVANTNNRLEGAVEENMSFTGFSTLQANQKSNQKFGKGQMTNFEETPRVEADDELRTKEEEATPMKIEESTILEELPGLKDQAEASIKTYEATTHKAIETTTVIEEEEARMHADEAVQLQMEDMTMSNLEEAKIRAAEIKRLKNEEEVLVPTEAAALFKAEEDSRIKDDNEARIQAVQAAEDEQKSRIHVLEEKTIKAEDTFINAELERSQFRDNLMILEEDVRIKIQDSSPLQTNKEARITEEFEANIGEEATLFQAEGETIIKAEETITRGEEIVSLQSEEETKISTEEISQLQVEEEERINANDEVQIQSDEATRLKVQEESLFKVEVEARINANEISELLAEEEAREDTHVQAEQIARLQADEATKIKVEYEANMYAEALAKLEKEEVRVQKEEAARPQAKKEAKTKTEYKAKIHGKEIARLQAERKARIETIDEAQIEVKRSTLFQAEEEKRINIKEITQLKAEEKLRTTAVKHLQIQVEEDARLQAEEKARAYKEGVIHLRAEEEMKTKLEKEVLDFEEQANIQRKEDIRLQLQEDEVLNFEKKVKEELLVENVRRKMLDARLREQKDEYGLILEKRRKERRDHMTKELVLAEEKKRLMIETQAALRAEKKQHDSLLYMVRRALLENRMKKQRLSVELELQKRMILYEQKGELNRRKMLVARLDIQKQDAELEKRLKGEQFERQLRELREELLILRLKEQADAVEEQKRKKEQVTGKKTVGVKVESKVKTKKEEDESRTKVEEAKNNIGEEDLIKAKDDIVKSEIEWKTKVEEEAKAKPKEDAHIIAIESKVSLKREDEAKAKEDEEARVEACGGDNSKVDEEARNKNEEEVGKKAKQEANLKIEHESSTKAKGKIEVKSEEVLKTNAGELQIKIDNKDGEREKEIEAKTKKELCADTEGEETKLIVERGLKLKAQQANVEHEARMYSEEKTKSTAGYARIKAEETRGKTEEEKTIKVDEEAKASVEDESYTEAKEDSKDKVEEETRPQPEGVSVQAEWKAKVMEEEENQIQVEEEARVQAEWKAKAKDEQEIRIQVEEEARVQAGLMVEEEEIQATAEEEARIEIKEKARVIVEQDEEFKINEQVRIRAEAKVTRKTEKEAIRKAKKSRPETKLETKFETEEYAPAKLDEESKSNVDEARTRVKKETGVKAEEETPVKVKEKAMMNVDQGDEPNVFEDEPNVFEGNLSQEENRIFELERLEKEFGLIDTAAVDGDKISQPSVPETEYQFPESQKAKSKLYDERSDGTLEKIEQKYDQIAQQQMKVAAHLAELERLNQNESKGGRKSDVGDGDDVKQTFSDDSELANDEEKNQDEEVVSLAERNQLEDEAKKLTDAVMKNDELYVPSKKILSRTSLFMKEVAGTSLENYNHKEMILSERDVGIHAGITLKIPVRVTVPGSIVEFSIERKSYDFTFGISAFVDGGQVTEIKEMAPFRMRSDTQKILVPAGSAPCTMQFKFTNNYSTLLEKVRVGYKIRVLPPSSDSVKLGRRRRTKASIKLLESEILSQREILKSSTTQVTRLDRDATILQNEICKTKSKIESIRAEEEHLKKVIESAGGLPLSTNRIDTNEYLNEI